MPSAATAAHLRPRSKTFEEYEKDTDDVWDDNEEDMSTPAQLEFPTPDDGRGERGGAANTRKQAGSNGGKGISECVCVCVCVCERESLPHSLSRNNTILNNVQHSDTTIHCFSIPTTGDLKSFFSDVVKPKSLSSPRSRPRSQSEKTLNSGKTMSPLADNEQRRMMGVSTFVIQLQICIATCTCTACISGNLFRGWGAQRFDFPSPYLNSSP